MSAKEQAEQLGIKVDGRWSEERILQEISDAGPTVVNAKPEGQDVVNIYETLEWANERAAKIWAGQSPNLSILERVGRIKLGLGDKGFTNFKALTLPTDVDYKRYL